MSDYMVERDLKGISMEALGGAQKAATGEPYWKHCEAVAVIVMLHTKGMDEAMVAAAYLHDVIEDTEASHQDIWQDFGPHVSKLVWEVTDASKPSDGNRATRKAIDRLHLSTASPEGKTIKLADVIDNTSSIVQHDPHFARVYLPEMVRVLEVLDGGSPVLMALARQMVEDGMKQLEISV